MLTTRAGEPQTTLGHKVVASDPKCYRLAVGDGRPERILAWIASVVAVGLLGAGVYAVFHSTNGSGAVALLTVGGLALFVAAFGDRIRSMEFGGARIQLALNVKTSLKKAFKLRLSGNYEEAEAEIEFAFSQFVTQEPHKVQRAYEDSKAYQKCVLDVLCKHVKEEFGGRVRETAATVSFLPLVDAVMIVDGDRFLEKLKPNYVCPDLKRKVEEEKTLRSAIIERPGPALDVAKLVERLEQEVTNGALGIDCFLLVQNCKDSDSRKQFCELVNGKGMHAKSLVWQPVTGSDTLKEAFQAAILTICSPSQCGYSQAASLTRHNSASQAPVTIAGTFG